MISRSIGDNSAQPAASAKPLSAALGKRCFDISCASIGILVLAPAGLVIAVLIKLWDRGPVLYGQTRIGQFGKAFRIWKFRSMVPNADKIGTSVTAGEDARITQIGRFLRKTKLDELPQLWNVLVGEMSIVGPRPEVPRYVSFYTPMQQEILKFKPGITDMASMLFRNEEALLRGSEDIEEFYLQQCLPRKIELNLEYQRRATLLQDIWVIVQTLCPYWLGVLVIYGLALAASLWVSYQLRSDFRVSSSDWEQYRRCLPWMILPQLGLLIWRGQLRGLMSYFSIPEMRRIAILLIGSLLLQAGLFFLFDRASAPAISIFFVHLILSFFALCGIRLGLRFLRERSSAPMMAKPVRPSRIAIVGTGSVATNLALECCRNQQSMRRVIAFFDDNPRNWQKRPHDIPVFGMPECLLTPQWLKELDEVIVALPDHEPARLHELESMLKRIPLKVTFASTSVTA